jgi:hypothetical protein
VDDGKEDADAAKSMVECGLRHYKDRNPHISKAIFVTDGAGCFVGTEFCIVLGYMVIVTNAYYAYLHMYMCMKSVVPISCPPANYRTYTHIPAHTYTHVHVHTTHVNTHIHTHVQGRFTGIRVLLRIVTEAGCLPVLIGCRSPKAYGPKASEIVL